MTKGIACCLALGVLMVALFVLNILVGSVSIPAEDICRILFTDGTDVKPSWHYIILQSRLPQALTALLADRKSVV